MPTGAVVEAVVRRDGAATPQQHQLLVSSHQGSLTAQGIGEEAVRIAQSKAIRLEARETHCIQPVGAQIFLETVLP